jgi:uncharacterized protein YqhQ
VSHQSIGGQAVIEGVMMRDKTHYSVAVRLPDGEIETTLHSIPSWNKVFNKPFLRGIKALAENLKIGYRTLQWSADKQEKESEKKPSSFWNVLAVLISILVAVGLFIVLPNLVIHFLGLVEKDTPVLFNLASGGIRLLVFLGYVLSISFLKDVKRLFQYHGAEHKTIHAFEDKKELSYENIKPYPTLHKRCGTSFIFLLIFVGILFFSVVPPILSQIFPDFKTWSLLLRKSVIFVSHIILIPFLAAFSYELLKISAKPNWIGKILVFIAYPGLFFQNVTTQEPDEKQVEVAVASLKVLLEKEEK